MPCVYRIAAYLHSMALPGLRHALVSAKTLPGQVVSLSSGGKPWPLQILVEVGVPFLVIFGAYENVAAREEQELWGGIEAQRRYGCGYD